MSQKQSFNKTYLRFNQKWVRSLEKSEYKWKFMKSNIRGNNKSMHVVVVPKYHPVLLKLTIFY